MQNKQQPPPQRTIPRFGQNPVDPKKTVTTTVPRFGQNPIDPKKPVTTTPFGNPGLRYQNPSQEPAPEQNDIPETASEDPETQPNKVVEEKPVEQVNLFPKKQDLPPMQKATNIPQKKQDTAPTHKPSNNNNQIDFVPYSEEILSPTELPSDPQNSRIEDAEGYNNKYEKINRPINALKQFQETFKQNAELNFASSSDHGQSEEDNNANVDPVENQDQDEEQNSYRPDKNDADDDDEGSQQFQSNAPPIQYIEIKKDNKNVKINQFNIDTMHAQTDYDKFENDTENNENGDDYSIKPIEQGNVEAAINVAQTKHNQDNEDQIKKDERQEYASYSNPPQLQSI